MDRRQAAYKTSKNNCCVVGCSNTYINAPPGTKFYRFPNEMFPGRKEKWLTAIRRVGMDGKPWIPTKNSRVCSQHFVGGQKSEHPDHPAFVPTLFPSCYRKRKSGSRPHKLSSHPDHVPSIFKVNQQLTRVRKQHQTGGLKKDSVTNHPTKSPDTKKKKPSRSKRSRKVLRPQDEQEHKEDYEAHLSSEETKYSATSSFTGDVPKESDIAIAAPSTDSHAEQAILGPRLASLLDPTADEYEGLPETIIKIKAEPPDEPEGNPVLSSVWEPKVEMSSDYEEPVA